MKDPFWVTKFEADTDATVQDQRSPYQDGSIYVDSMLEPMYITIDIEMFSDSQVQILRSWVSRVFNPKLGPGLLVHEVDGVRKEIFATSEHVPLFPSGDGNRFNTFQKATISLKAPSPYWLDPVQNTRELKAYEGDFTFPFEFPVQFGIESDTTTIYNEGDTEAPVVVEINGPITRPLIENITTGEHMQINAIIQADQTLVIDTSPRNKRVEIRSENETRKVMGFFDHGGDFWLLAPGENEIRYRADAGIAEATATLSYQSQYVGI